MLIGELHWANPAVFLLLLLIPIFFIVLKIFEKRNHGIKFSALKVAWNLSQEFHQNIRHLPMILRMMVLLLCITVMARPQGVLRSVNKQVESLDIMLVLDLSESMRAYDIRPNRLVVAKRVLERFIKGRLYDHIGLVVFSGTPLTLSPLTTDHGSILSQLNSVQTNTIGVEGTAMGEGLLMAVNRLLDYRSVGMGKSIERNVMKQRRQIVILATDGVNNRGVQPLLAAKIMAEKKIKLYTIGLGGEKKVLRYEKDFDGNDVPLYDLYGRAQYWDQPDEKVLRELAAQGEGMYFNAHNQASFDAVMDEIDGLEKNLVSLNRDRIFSEHYFLVLLIAILILLIESILRAMRFPSMR